MDEERRKGREGEALLIPSESPNTAARTAGNDLYGASARPASEGTFSPQAMRRQPRCPHWAALRGVIAE